MKKIALFAAAGLMTLAACQENGGYTIDGTVVGAADGEYVYLNAYKGRGLAKLDSAVVKAGKFQFKGTPDTIATPKMLLYSNKEVGNLSTQIFLDKGNMVVNLEKGKSTVSGTSNNEALVSFMQAYRTQGEEMNAIYKEYRNSDKYSQAQRDSMMTLLEQKEKEQQKFVFEQAKAHVADAFGAYLLASMGTSFEIQELSGLLEGVQEPYASSESILKLKDYVANSLKTMEGKKFVDFSMPDVDGKTVKLSDFIKENKYTLIDFWASWCGPCRAEMPNVVAAYKELHTKGFGIVGVSLDSDAKRWKNAIEDLQMTWNHMSDLKGWSCEGAKLYGVRSIPATVLVDQEGTIIARNLRGEQLIEKLRDLMK